MLLFDIMMTFKIKIVNFITLLEISLVIVDIVITARNKYIYVVYTFTHQFMHMYINKYIYVSSHACTECLS